MPAYPYASNRRSVVSLPSPVAGFTLIELVVVMLLVATLSIVVLQRVQPTENNMPAQADQLARDIRHMQTIAANWAVPMRLTATAAGYSVACLSGPTPPCNGVGVINDPAPRDGQLFQVPLQAGISSSVTTLNVDIYGRPCDAPCASGANVQNMATTFTLSGGGRMSLVTVRPLTGHITVTY
ncbi:MAG: type II secretion system protein [Gammaproteobacteria bacterium]